MKRTCFVWLGGLSSNVVTPSNKLGWSKIKDLGLGLFTFELNVGDIIICSCLCVAHGRKKRGHEVN